MLPVSIIWVTIEIDDDINDISLNDADSEPVHCEIPPTLILFSSEDVNAGNALNPSFRILIIIPIDCEIDADSALVPGVPPTNETSPTCILFCVFSVRVGNELVPFMIISPTKPNEDEIEPVTEPLAAVPLIWTESVTLTKPVTEEVNAGIAPNPPSIIEVTTFQFSSIKSSLNAGVIDEVVWVPLVTLNGLYTPQSLSVSFATIAGIALKPRFTILSTILNELLIFNCSDSVPETDEVMLFRAVTFIKLSSLVIILGVSRMIF